jgi:multisubunit Na+/H+ antiporter MnhB subunit
VPARITRRELYASFGGGIFGGTAWLLILAGLVKDWVSFGAILACDLLVFLAVAEVCVRHPQRYWSLAVVMVGALMAVTLTIVNLRWTAWMHAYRQSTAYDPINDVNLTTINLVVLGAFIALLSVFATRYIRQKATRKGQTPGDRRQM